MNRRTISVDSITDLKAVAYADYEWAYLTGYYAANDGGCCIYIWDASSAAADDGFLVIAPATPPANGRWLRHFEDNIINVLSAGIISSASQPDALINTPIMYKILAYAALTPSRVIYFPAGNYYFADAIRLPSHTSIKGDGIRSTLMAGIDDYEEHIPKPALITNVAFDPSNLATYNSHITISSICINANNTDWVSEHSQLRGIYFNKVQDVLIEDVTVLYTIEKWAGIAIRNFVIKDNNPYSFITTNCVIDRCKVERDVILYPNDNNPTEQNIYIDSVFWNTIPNPDEIIHPGATTNIKITDTISIGGIHAISLASVKDSIISGCTTRQGVRGIFISHNSFNIIVENNAVYDSIGSGIHLAYRNSVITIHGNTVGNVVKNTGTYEGNGIKCYMGCYAVTVTNNIVYGCATDGIVFYSGLATRNITIANNSVTDNQGSGIVLNTGAIVCPAIEPNIDFNIYNVVISNNTAYGNQVSGILLTGHLSACTPSDVYYLNTKVIVEGNLVTNNQQGISVNHARNLLLKDNNVLYNSPTGDYFKGTDITLQDNFGEAIFTGDGATTVFLVQHYLDKVPKNIVVTAKTAAAASPYFLTADVNFIYVNFLTAPASAASLIFDWAAEAI